MMEVLAVVVGDTNVAQVVLNNTEIDEWRKVGTTTNTIVNKGMHE